MTRKNFAFRFAWREAIAHLSPELRLEIIEATIRYAETGQTGELSAAAAEAFEQYIMPDFRRRAKAAEYRARRKARLTAEQVDESASPAPAVADFHLAIDCPKAGHRPEVLPQADRVWKSPVYPSRKRQLVLSKLVMLRACPIIYIDAEAVSH